MFGFASLKNYTWNKFVHWLTFESPDFHSPLTSFERLRYELRPGDVILVEGRSKIGDIIKSVTQSIWTHSFFYIGRLHDIDDPLLREHILRYRHCQPDEQLIIESMLGKGTIVNAIDVYEGEHLRICRPRGITRNDSQKVIAYAIDQLGVDYNVRQIMDLFRFMFPYWFIPKRWRSSLFEHNAGRPTENVCSTMMAEAFAAVRFPIIPVLHQDKSGNLKLLRRNSKLITPCNFDHSPYFDVIKYPVLDFDELGVYRKLPWDQTSVHNTAAGDSFYSDPEEISKLKAVYSSSDINQIYELLNRKSSKNSIRSEETTKQDTGTVDRTHKEEV
jgi:hypothetical protein